MDQVLQLVPTRVPTCPSCQRPLKDQDLEDVAVQKAGTKRKNTSSSEENAAHSSHDTRLSEVRGTCASRSLNCLVHARVLTGIQATRKCFRSDVQTEVLILCVSIAQTEAPSICVSMNRVREAIVFSVWQERHNPFISTLLYVVLLLFIMKR